MTTDGIVTVTATATATVAGEMPRGTVAAVEAPVGIETTTTGTATRTVAGTAP